MNFQSTQIQGKGRGKKIGIPTINLKIPEDFNLEEGIYAALVKIDGQTYKGALHFGPVPVFNQIENSLEVMLLHVSEVDIPKNTEKISIEIKKRIREIKSFNNSEDLRQQVEKDVEEVNKALA